MVGIVTICPGREGLEYGVVRCLLRHGRTDTRARHDPLCDTRFARCPTFDKTMPAREQVSLDHPRDSLWCYNYPFYRNHPAPQSSSHKQCLDNAAYTQFAL